MNSAARASGQSERREKVQPGPSSDAIMAGRTRPPGPASSTPGAVVFGNFPDDHERLGLLFVYPGHFRFVGHVVEGQREHNVKSLFRSHGATSQWVQRAREAPFEIIQNGGKRDACVASAIAMISFSFQSLVRELWYGMALRRLHGSPFDCFCSNERIRAPSKAWLPGFTWQLTTRA